MAEISEWRTDAFIDGNTPVYDMLCKVEDLINDADEAYSVEAVVRELEELRLKYADGSLPAMTYNNGISDAIAIVKRGGRDENI